MAVRLAIIGDGFDGVFFVFSFFQRDVLVEIWDYTGPVSENFHSYSFMCTRQSNISCSMFIRGLSAVI